MRQAPRYQRNRSGRGPSLLALVPVLALSCLFASAQSPAEKPASAPAPQEPAKPADASQGEVVTRDSNATFKVRVNLVLVRVVVRDDHGNAIDNLKKEDFLLYDNRKPQSISSFSMETPLSHTIPVVSVGDHPATDAEGAATAAPAPALPQRFVSLLFDDIHMSMEDAVTVRVAAGRILDSLAPSDRVGIYTTSGQFGQEFTADRNLLKESLNQIVARPLPQTETHDCPEVSYYQADLIENRNDDQALAVATEDAVQCAFSGDESKINLARPMAMSAAARALSGGDTTTDYAYSHMQDALRRLAAMPGQRKLVFISPGFLMSTLFAERSDAIDRSNRSGIVIDTLDVRGLYTPDVSGDISNPPRDSYRTSGHKAFYRVAAQSAQSEILQDLPLGTGGTYFHNRNDLDVALRESIAAPRISYLLGFSPQNLKLNGSFHSLKVSLAGKLKYSVQARRGYYAPRTLKSPEEAAKEEIQEAVFSQEEIRDLPIDLQTQFFRKDGTQARLSVLAHVDLKSLKFRKVEGRNHDDLTLATVIFDENGNYVTGGEKILEMKLRDATLERLDRSGITVKSSFDIKPGNYLVRLVVRDKEGELMAARNGAVVIPY
jgi:VWFA-related protein